MVAPSNDKSRILDSYSKNGKSKSLREEIFALLDADCTFTPKMICQELQVSYKDYQNYVSKTKWEWRSYRRNERGSKCSTHGWHGWCYLPFVLSKDARSSALGVGWRASKSRNRWLMWKDRLGRLQWFETGRVNLYVRKPAKMGKAYQLVCNAFSFTGLITDIKVLEGILAGVRFKGAHYVFPIGVRLPKLTVDLFSQSSGLTIKVGDESHPDSLEVIASYPDWAERNERLIGQLSEVLKNLGNFGSLNDPKRPGEGQRKPEYLS